MWKGADIPRRNGKVQTVCRAAHLKTTANNYNYELPIIQP